MDRALEHATQLLSSRGRDGPWIVVLLTAGKQAAAPDAKPLDQAVQPLKRLGARIYVVAVGRDPDTGELIHIVDRRMDIFLVVSAPELPEKAKSIGKSSKNQFISFLINTGLLVLKKNCFSTWTSTLNMGLINKYGMFVACGICLADVFER